MLSKCCGDSVMTSAILNGAARNDTHLPGTRQMTIATPAAAIAPATPPRVPRLAAAGADDDLALAGEHGTARRSLPAIGAKREMALEHDRHDAAQRRRQPSDVRTGDPEHRSGKGSVVRVRAGSTDRRDSDGVAAALADVPLSRRELFLPSLRSAAGAAEPRRRLELLRVRPAGAHAAGDAV